MPPINLGALLLPLIGGFIFLQIWPYTRFLLRKQEGYSLFLAASAAGVTFLMIARLVFLAISQVLGGTEAWSQAARVFHRIAPFDYAGTFVGALVIGLVAPFLSIAIDRTRSAGQGAGYLALRRVARQDGLLSLLLKAREEKYPVLISLKNRKAYVGYIISTDHLALEMPYFRLLPTIAMYRTIEELRLQISHVYDESQELLERFYGETASGDDQRRLENLEIVLRVEEVLSASTFNEDLFLGHQEDFLQAEVEGVRRYTSDDRRQKLEVAAEVALRVWEMFRSLGGRSKET